MTRRFRTRRAGIGRFVPPAAPTRRRVAAGFLLVALFAPLLLPIGSAAATRLPAGYREQTVAQLPNGQPIGLAFLPDGGLLVTSKEGRLFLVENATSPTLATPRVVLDLSARTCGNGERGLLGVAVDPAFATNGYVYLYYTFKRAPGCPMGAAGYPLNRVSRFTLDGSSRPETTEQVLVANIASYQGNHNGGDLNFGNDGFLYVSIGDGGCQIGSPTRCQPDNRNARFGHILHGKILRITSDGAPAPGNPFSGPGTAPCAARGFAQPGQRCQEIFAFGLRNPFRFAFDPNTPPNRTRFYINDVGGKVWEEIDPAGDGYEGADYG